jgi:hypothetical protein
MVVLRVVANAIVSWHNVEIMMNIHSGQLRSKAPRWLLSVVLIRSDHPILKFFHPAPLLLSTDLTKRNRVVLLQGEALQKRSKLCEARLLSGFPDSQAAMTTMTTVWRRCGVDVAVLLGV